MNFRLRIWRQKDRPSPGALVDYDAPDIPPQASLLEMLDLHKSNFQFAVQVEPQYISVVRLDDFFPEKLQGPLLVKIDVQGYELEVLSACEPLLPLFQFVYVELSYVELYEGQALAGQVIRHLAESQFQLLGVYNQSTDSYGKPVQADFLFANARRAGEAAAKVNDCA